MKALVVVDYQNDYVKGPLGSKYAKLIEGNICARIEEVLKDRGTLFLVIDYLPPNHPGFIPDGKKKPVKCCIAGTAGADVYGKVGDYLSSGYMIRKDALGSEELLKRLKSYDDIEICGLETNTGIIASAVFARTASPSATVSIRQNCITSGDSELGEEALNVMASMGIRVL